MLTLRRSDGFGVIEVMMAVLVLTIGLLGAMYALVSSDHLNLTTERVQAAATAAEQRMEQLKATSYSAIALSTLPTHTTDGNAGSDTSRNPSDPDYWVSGTNLLVVTSFNSESSSTLAGVSSTGEPMVSGGTISPGPMTVSSNGFTVELYTFISWVADDCVYLGLNLCPGTENAKRLTVAAILVGGGGAGVGASKPFWLSTVVANPNA